MEIEKIGTAQLACSPWPNTHLVLQGHQADDLAGINCALGGKDGEDTREEEGIRADGRLLQK